MINFSEKELVPSVQLSPVLGAYHYEKEYRVLVARHPDEEQLATWRRGVVLEDGYQTSPAKVRFERFKCKGA